jgi:hypothetical protein
MGVLFVSRLPDIVIANTAQFSNIFKAREVFEDAEVIMLYGVSVTDGAITYNFQVCPNIDATTPLWYDFFPAGALLAPPAQSQAIAYSRATVNDLMAADAIRLKASAGVTANRNWNLTKHWRAS